jgi:hypothetical protein
MRDALKSIIARARARTQSTDWQRQLAEQEAEDRRREQEYHQGLCMRREAVFRRNLGPLCADSERFSESQWTAIRRDIHITLRRRPGAWVLLTGTKGTGKSVALVYEGLRAIRAGRTVAYVAGLGWSERYVDHRQVVSDLLDVDLLLLDELNELASVTNPVRSMAHGVIDWRYRHRDTKQTLAAATKPLAFLEADPFPEGMVDRFEFRFGRKELESQRRKKER